MPHYESIILHFKLRNNRVANLQESPLLISIFDRCPSIKEVAGKSRGGDLIDWQTPLKEVKGSEIGEEGSKIWEKCMTSFMDGLLYVAHYYELTCLYQMKLYAQ